jgi:hypothetical protein
VAASTKPEQTRHRSPTGRQVLGGVLAVIAAGFTVALAIFGNTKSPPPASTQGLLAFLGILAQFGAVWAFAGHGKADPTLAQRSVGRLVNLAQQAHGAKLLAERMQAEDVTPAKARLGVGQLSVHLSYLEEGYIEAIDDWRMFHPKVVEDAERKTSDDE